MVMKRTVPEGIRKEPRKFEFKRSSRVSKSKPKWRQQEERAAIRLNGKRDRKSGAEYNRTVAGGRGDGKNDYLEWECKTTSKDSFRITTEMLDRIETRVLLTMKSPAIYVSFENRPKGKEKDWVLIPVSVMEDLMERD